jgi:hypothetical protein
MFPGSATSQFINDGQTRIARVEEGPFHPPLLFEYRPMLWHDRRTLRTRLRRFAGEESAGFRAAEEAVIRELSRRLLSWTLLDRSGRLAPITDETVRTIEPHLLASVASIVLGLQPGEEERSAAAERNLVRGVRLLLVAPHLAARDCRDCETFVYDETTGRRARQGGRPIPRPAGAAPPCRWPHVGCPKGTPECPNTLSAENEAAYRFHEECRAVGKFPDDPIVGRHAALIARVERLVARQRSAASGSLSANIRSLVPVPFRRA